MLSLLGYLVVVNLYYNLYYKIQNNRKPPPPKKFPRTPHTVAHLSAVRCKSFEVLMKIDISKIFLPFPPYIFHQIFLTRRLTHLQSHPSITRPQFRPPSPFLPCFPPAGRIAVPYVAPSPGVADPRRTWDRSPVPGRRPRPPAAVRASVAPCPAAIRAAVCWS